MTTADLLCAARAVKPAAAALSTAEKNRLLEAMAQALLDHADNILAANAADVEAARGVIAPVMIDRLSLSPARVESMAEGMRAVAALPDPVGELLSETARPNGLVIRKVRVPMGVIAIIYESRPNVTADAAALCLKSGNVCVLRGGKEAIRSNTAVVAALRAGLEHCGAPGTLVNLVEDTSRASAAHLMEARGFVDLLIPQGRQGPHPRLRGQRQGALHRNRHGYLPYLCGCRGRPAKSPGHRIQRENEPSVRVQRRRGLPGSPGRCRSVPARVGRASGR